MSSRIHFVCLKIGSAPTGSPKSSGRLFSANSGANVQVFPQFIIKILGSDIEQWDFIVI